MTTQEIIEVIKGLSVLELNDLVKACEEEFGVSAAAGVVVAAAGAGAAAAEEKTEFDVELTEAGDQNKTNLKKAGIMFNQIIHFIPQKRIIGLQFIDNHHRIRQAVE